MFSNLITLRLILTGLILYLDISPVYSQETNSRASGKIISAIDKNPVSSSVILIHEPTQNQYATGTGSDGYFYFFNLKPGGPYTVIISATGFVTHVKKNLFIHLSGEHFLSDNDELSGFLLEKKIQVLDEIKLSAVIAAGGKTGMETIVPRSIIQSMPSISRGYQDVVRLVPQARVKGDGTMSLAGQNNRFNAFYIDGANSNDLRGLAVNGMIGGQTGSPPVSIEALEEINVALSPYHVQYGNFTGGIVNAVTRSGSNESKSSAWYYFRNEDLAGRSPTPMENAGAPGEYHRPKLSSFLNQTYGLWNSGALKKNKLFYFILLENQSETQPQPFNFTEYLGNSNQRQLESLTDTLKKRYAYDPGSFLESSGKIEATRLNVKVDLNASVKNKFAFSYRHNNAKLTTAPRPSSPNAVSFQNNGIVIPAITHSLAFEWKYFLPRNRSNRLLLTYTDQKESRERIGDAFPGILILDGSATISFGSEPGTGLNNFKAKDLGLFDVFSVVKKKHSLSIGTDLNFTANTQSALPNYFGSYQFRSLNDFMHGISPSRFQRNYYAYNNNVKHYSTLRTSLFINDEFKPRQHIKLNFGIRLDGNAVLSRPVTDPFFNDSAIGKLSSYYNLEGARSGQMMKTNWILSPRVGLEIYFPKNKIGIKTGAGLFVGHLINFWIFDVFNSDNISIDIAPQQFYADPYNQPTVEFLNLDPVNNKGNTILMAKHFKYPSVFRTSLAVEKKLSNNWSFLLEGLFTKNINEMLFRNINILPPVSRSALPGSRNIYSLSSAVSKIPLRNNGINPYSSILLVTNNNNKTGYSWFSSFIVSKQAKDLVFNSSYTYGRSVLLFEVTGPQTPVFSQWRNMETVNGRNFTTLSRSDNDLGHRISAWVVKKINYMNSKLSTSVALLYNGQSGSPYSYVYTNSMINDNVRRNENFDLVYIPTRAEVSAMNFFPATRNGILYTEELQREYLNTFIESDKYLKKHRGQFAARNGARLPCTHVVDLKMQQAFKFGLKNRALLVLVSYDVFNITNMLNRNWGRTWFLLNDSYPLIRFESFINTSTYTPQYQFIPEGKLYTVQSGSVPGSSARWISQLGVKLNWD